MASPTSHERRRPDFLSAALQTYGSQIAVAVLSLVNALVMARVLGATGRGEVVFLTAIAFFTSNLSTWGVQEANVNLAGTEPRSRPALATNSLVFSILFGGLGAAAVLLLSAVFPAVTGDASSMLLAVTLGSLPALVLNVYMRFLLQGEYGFAVTNIAWVLPAVVNVTVNTALAVAGALTVAAAVGTWLGGQILSTGILVWYVARWSSGFGRPSLALARRTLHFGARSHGGRIMLIANYRLDQWILGAIAGSRELGLYSVAVAWAEGLFLLPTALSAVQRPDLVRASRREASRLGARVFRISMLLTLVAAALLVLLAPFLCVVVFGEEFRDSIPYLRVLAGGAFGIVALKQLGSALTARQKPTLSSLAIGAAFVSTVALDFALIPDHGGLGAAIASSVSYTLGGIVVVALFIRVLGGSWLDFLPRLEDFRSAVLLVRRLAGRRPRPSAEPLSGPDSV